MPGGRWPRAFVVYGGDPMPRPGTTTIRGYGTAHQRERERWRPRVEAGLVDCGRCGERLRPDRPWDLGHDDDRRQYRGPEHPSCNRKAGGANGALVTNALRRPRGARQSRDW
mgnify:CR=1 FL=1